MAIQFTTPINPGIVDPGKTYTHAKIMMQRQASGTREGEDHIDLELHFGWMEGGEFKRSKRMKPRSYTICGDDYNTLVSTAVTSEDDGHLVYVGAKNNLYQWIMAHDPDIVGTIV